MRHVFAGLAGAKTGRISPLPVSQAFCSKAFSCNPCIAPQQHREEPYPCDGFCFETVPCTRARVEWSRIPVAAFDVAFVSTISLQRVEGAGRSSILVISASFDG